MTFEDRMAGLGVDLSDLPRKWMTCASEPYSGEQCYKAHGAAWAWYVGEDQRAVPELEQQETTRDRMILRQYILHIVDIIDRMETRLVNVTGERDWLKDVVTTLNLCETCGAPEDGCDSCTDWPQYEYSGVPEDWRPDDD